MKRPYTLLRIFSIASVLLGFAACNYLDVVPTETATAEDGMKEKNDVLNFLYSCYSNVRNSEACMSFCSLECSTDESICPVLWTRVGQVAAWNQLSSTYTSDWWPTDLPWNYCYNSVGYCYRFLSTLETANPRGVTEEDKDEYRAEINFLLAYYHFRALRAYGPIPIIDHLYPTSTPKSEFPGRSHFDYCVDKIVEWLDEASEVLPATRANEDIGRATSTICKAMKSRLLLYAASPLWNGSFPYQNWENTNYETPGYGKELVSHTYDRKKWERARDASIEAIEFATTEGNRSLLDLASSESIRSMKQIDLPNIPGTNDEFKKEVMLMRYVINSSELDGNRESIWSVIPEINNTWRPSFVPHGLVTSNDGNPQGGFNAAAPLLNAVERFYTNNGLLPENDPSFYKESEWFESARYSGRTNIIKLDDRREPRFYAWLSFDGDELSQRIANGEPVILELRNSSKHGYNPTVYNRDNGESGFVMKKFLDPSAIIRSDGTSFNFDVVPAQYYRLAEMYLNLAECYDALDQTDEAIEMLNIVRKRAGIPEITAEDITPKMTLTDWIRNERFVELFGEGHRYYDARRWMIAPDVFKAGVRMGLNAKVVNPSFEQFNTPTLIDQPFEWDNRMYILPIKSTEVYANPQLVQAPNY